MSATNPPLATLNSNDRGGSVMAASYTLIFNTILFCIIRIVTTLRLRRTWGWDDLLLASALFLAIGQTVVEEKAANSGLGKHFDSLTDKRKDLYFKLSFTSNILWLAVQVLAKTCAVYLMQRLITIESRVSSIVCPAVHGVNAVWFIFSVFAIAFQCNSPRWVYRPDTCVGQGVLWYPIIIVNILTDATISSAFIPVIWRLHMANDTKFTVCMLFGFRLSVCFVSIAQLAFLAPALTAHDTTWKMVVPEILKQCVMNLSVVSAASPSLHRFLNEVTSGTGFGMTVRKASHRPDYSTSSKNRMDKWASRNNISVSTSKDTTLVESTKRPSDNEGVVQDGRQVMDFRPNLVSHGQNSSHLSQIEGSHRPLSTQRTGEVPIPQTGDWRAASFNNPNQAVEMSRLPPTQAWI